jgi:hypothetical protein
MPYKTRKVKGKGTCVYKKDSGRKVGCTTGPIKKYLAALHLSEIIKEEIEDFEWIKDVKCPVRRGDMFHVKDRVHGPTTVVMDVSPDCKWVRRLSIQTYREWKSGLIGSYIRQVFSDWERLPYNDSNATKMSQVIKNLNTGFWTRVDEDGDKLDFGYVRESEDFDWISQQEPPKRIEVGAYNSGEYILTQNYFKEKGWEINYKGWEISVNGHSGTVEWYHPQIAQTLYYATPYWDGRSNVPIDFQTWFGDEEVYEGVGSVEIPNFEYEWELLDWMDTQYFDLVHKQIIEHTGPLPE